MLKQKEKQRSLKHDIYDVVIIGGGISGMTCAYLLSKGGKKVLLIDNTKLKATKIQFSEVLSMHAQQLLQDIFDKFSLEELDGIGLEKNILKWNSSAVSVKNYHNPFQPQAIERNILKQYLKEILAQKDINYRVGCHVIGIEQKGNYTAVCTSSGATTDIINSRFVIIASGRIGRRIIDVNNVYRPEAISCGFHVPFKGDESFYIEGIGPSGDWWYTLPSGNNGTFVCASITKKHFKTHRDRWQLIYNLYGKTELIRSLIPNLERPSSIHYRWGGSYDWGTCVGNAWACVGDAAYVQHPLSGRGMDFALHSAMELSNMMIEQPLHEALSTYNSMINKHISYQENSKQHFLKENVVIAD